MTLNPTIADVTERIRRRSAASRSNYLARMAAAAESGPRRAHLTCGNQAHAYAAMGADKTALAAGRTPNIGIITAYNDMLSAHQPYETYPALIREAARKAGATAQVAGGVPAMCDGVTQGQTGMELSLFSRDVIALAAGVGLSHNTFDATLYLGVCDKIVPGLVMAAATFGYLPAVFLPAGPMTSGIPNDEKAKVRQKFAVGEATRDELMASEMASYHGPGTCTFYGTANSNQMLMEFMGLHLPGASFVNPGTPLREALTIAGAERALEMAIKRAKSRTAFGQKISEMGVTKAHVADMRMEIDMARLLTLKAAWMMDTAGNKSARNEIAMIKVIAPKMACDIIDWAMQVHGGGGMCDDFPLAYSYASARTLRFADGPDEVHRNAIAKAELGKYTPA